MARRVGPEQGDTCFFWSQGSASCRHTQATQDCVSCYRTVVCCFRIHERHVHLAYFSWNGELG